MKRRIAGFTLLELLAVITIIAILATLAAIGIANAARRARDARRQSDLVAVKQALSLYQQDTGGFPPDGTAFTPAGLGAMLAPNYMGSLPRDPRYTQPAWANNYVYHADPTSENFMLYANLEYKNYTTTTPSTVTACDSTAAGVAQKGNGIFKPVAAGSIPCYRNTND